MNLEQPDVEYAIRFINDELAGLYPAREIRGFTELIFEHLLNYSKTDLLIRNDTKLSNSAFLQIEKIVGQLLKHKPIQYILGEAWFYGLKLEVSPDVLIPRQETEELVKWIIDDTGSGPVKVLDIGTGSGCIAIGLSLNLPFPEVTAIDISDGALDVAAKNAERLGADIGFIKEDIFAPAIVNSAKYDIIVSNPPYVTESEKMLIDSNVLHYEPVEALFVPDNRPLVYYEAILALAAKCLTSEGRLYLEINEGKFNEIAELLRRYMFGKIEIRKDLNGKYRMVRACARC